MNTTSQNKNRIIAVGAIVLLLFAVAMLIPNLVDREGLREALPGAAGEKGKPSCADVELGTPCVDKGNSGSGGGGGNSSSSSSSSSKSNKSGGKDKGDDCSGVGIGTPCP